MSIEKERNTREISLSERSRDLDIMVLSAINFSLEADTEMRFVLTGSHAIEALTGNKLDHDDIDANIFTTSLKANVPRVAELVGELSVRGTNLSLFKETEDRLEFDILPNQANSRRLEIQFAEVSKTAEPIENFDLKNGGKIPTIIVPIKDSKGHEFLFRVKSLPYSIATWAIRISGFARNSKRSLKESDLIHLKLLMTAGFREEDVFTAMNEHPQMPRDMSVIQVFHEAVKKIDLII